MYVFSNSNVKYIETSENLIFFRKLNLSLLSQSFDYKNYNWLVSGQSSEDEFHNGFIEVCKIYEEKTKHFINFMSSEIFKIILDEFKSIDPNANFLKIERALISRSHSRGKMFSAVPHCDSGKIGNWSFLIHFKGTSGDTVFYNNGKNLVEIKKISFEPFNLIIFPSVYTHQGFLPTDTNDRYILNYIIDLDTHLNKKVLSKSLPIIQKLYQHNIDI